MKAYTDLEQSKKLAEILPLESADMFYCYGMDIHTKVWSFDNAPTIIDNSNQIDVDFDIPCWSLAVLLDVLPKGTNISTPKPFNALGYCCWNQYYEIYKDNPVDACYEMIIKLNEIKILLL